MGDLTVEREESRTHVVQKTVMLTRVSQSANVVQRTPHLAVTVEQVAGAKTQMAVAKGEGGEQCFATPRG